MKYSIRLFLTVQIYGVGPRNWYLEIGLKEDFTALADSGVRDLMAVQVPR
jgi:hypothetical protein